MSKKKRPEAAKEEEGRRSRKEVLVAQKEAEQTRGIRIGLGIVAGLILLIIAIAVVNEFFITPNREVATVDDTAISLKEFQDRVEYERVQRIIFLETQLKNFNEDVGIVQQFAGQWIVDLLPNSYSPGNSEKFGEVVLNQMVDEKLIEEAAAERGIEVSDAEVDEAVGAEFGYYGGGLPTPLPTATETIVPTPSLTPIPTAVITEVLPTATTIPELLDEGPTSTPFPTATPVSEESFQEQFDEFFKDYTAFNVTDDQYREGFRIRLLRERLTDALAIEQELPTDAEHANMFIIATSDQEAAEELASLVSLAGYLPTWNEIRSRPFDPESPSTVVATELLRRTKEDLVQAFGEDVASAAFELDIDTPSGVLTAVGEDGSTQYFVLMVSGREMLELNESALQAKKDEALAAYLAELRESKAVINNFWRGRVPTLPLLDTKFLATPTPAPEVIQPEVTVESE